MTKRFIQVGDNIKDTLTGNDLFELDAEDESKYRLAIIKMNRIWDGYNRAEIVNNEMSSEREMVLKLISDVDIKKAKKDELKEALIEIEKILSP